MQAREEEADGVTIWTFFPVVLSQKTPPKSIISLTEEYKILLLSSDAPYELYVMGKDYWWEVNKVLLVRRCIKSLRPLGIHLINYYIP